MARTALRHGPYDFNYTSVANRISSNEKGAYALGYKNKKTGGMHVLRIGRSDHDLRKRLIQYLSDVNYNDCTHFFFEVLNTQQEAFEMECCLYHDYLPIKNDIHPARPARMNCCCPVSYCSRLDCDDDD